MITIRDMKKILTILSLKYKLPKITIQIKSTRCGRARFRTNKITLPKWIFTRIKEYQLYYIIHEICHFITLQGHTDKFKQVETDILKEYNILPIYNKAYPKELRDLSGKVLCNNYGVK